MTPHARRLGRPLLALSFACYSAGCAHAAGKTKAPETGGETAIELDVPGEWVDPAAGLARPRIAARPTPTPARATRPIAIRHATILTADGGRIEDGGLVMENGRIAAIGAADIAAPAGALEIDGRGRFVTPGIIDTHSHIGVYPAPEIAAHEDGNEMTAPVTADVAAATAYWPQDPAIPRAMQGGVTAAQILPGSANLVGGLGATVEMRPGRGFGEVAFAGAPPTLKMACGENPKRVYGAKGGPQTRMGMYAAFRTAFQQAAEYNAKLAVYEKERALWEKKRARAAELEAKAAAEGKKGRVKPEPAPGAPGVDRKLEVLAAVLRDEILVQVHCYRADEILEMVDIADTFGFEIRSFHHALEAYKVRETLAKKKVAISTWADWWGFKIEAFDGIPENAALFAAAGGRAVIHSDSPLGIQRLNQEAAKAMYAGRDAGLAISEDEALRWITAHAAWVLGIDGVTGTLAAGKRADVVLWSAHPFSVYARPDLVLVAGEVTHDRAKGRTPTDFELGHSAAEAR